MAPPVTPALKLATKSSSSSSAARRMIERRALQCSFSSVFHLKKAGMPTQQAKEIEHLFVMTVGLPLVFMGTTGFFYA